MMWRHVATAPLYQGARSTWSDGGEWENTNRLLIVEEMAAGVCMGERGNEGRKG
jgi:hypothetical protein